MKNFTLLSAAVLIASSCFASPAARQFQTSSLRANQVENAQKAVQAAPKSHMIGKLADFKIKNTISASGMRKVTKPTDTDILDTKPEGTESSWSRDALSWFSFWGYAFSDPVYGAQQSMVETADGKVYISNPFSAFPLYDVWIEGTKNADGSLSFKSGQLVYEEYDPEEEETYSYYAVALKISSDDELLTLDEIMFKKDGDNYVQVNPDIMLALCGWIDDEEEGGSDYGWTGYADSEAVWSPMNATMAVVPDDVVLDEWACVSKSDAHISYVGFKDSKVYIKGLLADNPDGVLVGDVAGDKITVAGGQFLGASDLGFWTFLYGGRIEEEYDDYWEEYVDVAYVTGDINFSYDADAKKMVCTDGAIIMTYDAKSDLSQVHAGDFFTEVALQINVRNPEALPAPATDVEFVDYFEDYGDYDFYFTIKGVDVDGAVLNPNYLYYRIFVDGELFTFYDDEYTMIPEPEMTLIPASYNDDWDIFATGADHCIYFYMEGIETAGVQVVYMQPVEGGEPKELCSEIVTAELAGVKGIVSDSAVASSTYFDLQGRKVVNPAAGLYIRRDVLTDGNVRTSKIAVK